MKTTHLAVAGLLALASLGASAQNQKPGLWEITSKMSGAGPDGEKLAKAQAQMQAQMAAMPPEKRKMMEDAMAQRGMKMGAGGPGGMTMKVCLTEEMVKRGQMSTGQAAQHGCTSTMSPRVGNTMKMAFTCTQPPSSGEGQFTFTSPDSYTMQMTTRSTRGGTEHQMSMEATGRWLSADCGSIKPITLPKQ